MTQNNAVAIFNQENGNTLPFAANAKVAGMGNTIENVRQIGYGSKKDNFLAITQRNGGNIVRNVHQSGLKNRAIITQLGGSVTNVVDELLQLGVRNELELIQDNEMGQNNWASIQQQGERHQLEINMEGQGHNIQVTQTGREKKMKVSLTGFDQSIIIRQ